MEKFDKSSGKGLLLEQWLPHIYVGEPLLDPLIQGKPFLGGKNNKFGQKKGKKGKRGIFQFWPPKNMIFRFFHENFQFLDFLTKTLKIL